MGNRGEKTRLLFTNGEILTKAGRLRGGWLLVEEGCIAALGEGEPPPAEAAVWDLAGALLMPGLIDLHTHGALGADTMDSTPEALERMARFYAAHGVTAFLATTMTAPQGEILAALDNIAAVMAAGTGGAALLGAHLEGPYLNGERRGCHDPAQVRRAESAEYARFFETGVVRLITLAPEYPEHEALIRYAAEKGAVVSLGHSRASYEVARRAVEWGASQVTHLFNAMDPLHHRAPGLVGAALTLEALDAQLIADNIHVHPAVLRLVVQAKGVERVILVTDAMSATGMPDGDYVLGNIAVTVRGGAPRTADGTLAGSTLTMERAVMNIMAAAALPLEVAWGMGSAVPARALGLGHRKGAIAVGMDADLVALDSAGGVLLTVVGGQIIFRREG
ncbi:MAG: N-acetylglucosamine-6-phosphate deacetylase [Chloroflexi bacterium]|nr:N-acetylglucosamine-6-phosphate deacetylase [Chloroflexota bacterium]